MRKRIQIYILVIGKWHIMLKIIRFHNFTKMKAETFPTLQKAQVITLPQPLFSLRKLSLDLGHRLLKFSPALCSFLQSLKTHSGSQEKCRDVIKLHISWNSWFFQKQLHHCFCFKQTKSNLSTENELQHFLLRQSWSQNWVSRQSAPAPAYGFEQVQPLLWAFPQPSFHRQYLQLPDSHLRFPANHRLTSSLKPKVLNNKNGGLWCQKDSHESCIYK